MIEKRLKKTAIMTAIFVVVSLSAMFYRAATKNVIIAEAGEETSIETNTIQQSELKLAKPTSDKGKGTLVIPLETGVTSDSISFEERHGQHQFVLYVKGSSPDFYNENSVITDLSCIEGADLTLMNDKGFARLTFQLDGLYENETSLGINEIVVSFKELSDTYENVVVIDPVDELGARLIPYLKTAFQDDERIKLYYTTLNGKEFGAEKTAALIADTGADFYIQLGIDETTESDSGIRTYYNDIFFIRGFGNVDLADKLESGTASAAGTRALGLTAAPSENVKLAESVIPSALVTIGNLNNRADHDKLEKDSYIEKCATGIADGIRAAFDVTNPSEDADENDALQGIINVN